MYSHRSSYFFSMSQSYRFLAFLLSDIMFLCRQWTCITTMSQTQTATAGQATTVSQQQLSSLFCIPPLPPISPSSSSVISHQAQALIPLLSLSFIPHHQFSGHLSLFSLWSPSMQTDFAPFILYFFPCFLFSICLHLMAVGTHTRTHSYVSYHYLTICLCDPTTKHPG